jgi:hypothetical protein
VYEIFSRVGNVLYWFACALAFLISILSILLVLVGKSVGLWFTIPVIIAVYLTGLTLRYLLRYPTG